MTRDEIVDFLEWAQDCGQLQFPESRKVDMAEMYIKEQEAVNKTCNIPHVSPRYYYVAIKLNENEIRLISGGFSKEDAFNYKQFIKHKYPTAFIIADFNEG